MMAATASVPGKGRTDRPINGIAALDKAHPGDLSFLGNAKYKSEARSTKASLVLASSDFKGGP